MGNISNLRNEYVELLTRSELISTEIGNILDIEFKYNEVPCIVTQHDIYEGLLYIESIDGTWISKTSGEKEVLSFLEFEDLIKKKL